MTNPTSKQRASDGRAVNDKGVPFAEILASLRRGESLDPVDVINAQSWRIDNQSREIASLRKQLLAARSPVETAAPQAPIAWVVVADNGGISASGSYAPGLPPGDHDLYCVPEAVAPMMRAVEPTEQPGPKELETFERGQEMANQSKAHVHRVAEKASAKPFCGVTRGCWLAPGHDGHCD